MIKTDKNLHISARADAGFPVGGRGPFFRGHGPPTWALFSENVCENERIGSHWGGGRAPENFVCRYASDTVLNFTPKIIKGMH